MLSCTPLLFTLNKIFSLMLITLFAYSVNSDLVVGDLDSDPADPVPRQGGWMHLQKSECGLDSRPNSLQSDRVAAVGQFPWLGILVYKTSADQSQSSKRFGFNIAFSLNFGDEKEKSCGETTNGVEKQRETCGAGGAGAAGGAGGVGGAGGEDENGGWVGGIGGATENIEVGGERGAGGESETGEGGRWEESTGKKEEGGVTEKGEVEVENPPFNFGWWIKGKDKDGGVTENGKVEGEGWGGGAELWAVSTEKKGERGVGGTGGGSGMGGGGWLGGLTKKDPPSVTEKGKVKDTLTWWGNGKEGVEEVTLKGELGVKGWVGGWWGEGKEGEGEVTEKGKGVEGGVGGGWVGGGWWGEGKEGEGAVTEKGKVKVEGEVGGGGWWGTGKEGEEGVTVKGEVGVKGGVGGGWRKEGKEGEGEVTKKVKESGGGIRVSEWWEESTEKKGEERVTGKGEVGGKGGMLGGESGEGGGGWFEELTIKGGWLGGGGGGGEGGGMTGKWEVGGAEGVDEEGGVGQEKKAQGLQVGDRTNSFCSVTLLNKRHCITVANCVAGPLKKLLYAVRLGQNFISHKYECDHHLCPKEIQEIPVKRVIIHEDYTGNSDNDIALVVLTRNAVLNDNVRPICFPHNSISLDSVHRIKLVALTGLKPVHPDSEHTTGPFAFETWGGPSHDHQEGTSISTLLSPCYTSNIRFAAPKKCSNFFSSVTHGRDMCLKNTLKKKMCPFFSGSPIMKVRNDGHRARYTLLGLDTSQRCGNERHSAFVNVLPFRRWVLDHLAGE